MLPGSLCAPLTLGLHFLILTFPFFGVRGMLAAWSQFCRKILIEAPSAMHLAQCRLHGASPARVPFALCPCESKKSFFSPFNPKHRLQLNLSFRDMNFTSWYSTGCTVPFKYQQQLIQGLARARLSTQPFLCVAREVGIVLSLTVLSRALRLRVS